MSIAAVISTGCVESEDKGNPVSCTIEISCRSLLEPGTKLKKGIRELIPENGVIISKQEVKTTDETSVLKATAKLCKEKKIPFIYKGFANGETGYVEGIYEIFEKDAGKTSGWMYRYNGRILNRSAGGKKVEQGADIKWYYVRSYNDK